MYAHCMFCHKALGANEEIEHFPVGRRLAYDEERGRLWVVCPRCRRWNLTPMEERWEALEECEKAFRGARLGAASENVSVARTRGGLDLVRIGAPPRRELAFWRWGERFGRRRRESLVWVGAAGVAVAVGTVGNLAWGGGAFLALFGAGHLASLWRLMGWRVRVEDGRGGTLTLPPAMVVRTRFGDPDAADGPSLVVFDNMAMEKTLTGEAARRAAAQILPRFNRDGAKEATVHEAVERLEEAGGPEGFLDRTWREGVQGGSRRRGASRSSRRLLHIPQPTRIGLEMALHEEEERRALAGELAGLEAMWRRAEELASIADDLLLPSGWDAFRRLHASDSGEG